MFEGLEKFDFESCSKADFFILARQTGSDLPKFIPLLQQLAKTAQRFGEEFVIDCKTCEIREKCDEHNSNRDIERDGLDCLLYKSLIPSIVPGKSYKERSDGLMDNYSDPDSSDNQAWSGSKEFQVKIREELFAPYERNKTIFSPEQWEVLVLMYKEGLTQKEIGKKLGLSRTAVSGRYIRAKKKYNDHCRKERDESA